MDSNGNETWKYEMGAVELPLRREVKPEGKYIIPSPHKYTYWMFFKDVLKDLRNKLSEEAK